MKTNTKSSARMFPWLFAALCLAAAVALFAPLVHAQDAGSPAATATAVTAASTPWYADPTLISVVIAGITSLLALWQNKAKTTAQKITESLVVGIEQATKLPEVAAAEAKMKAKIQSVATDYGVQPLLDRIVQDLT